MSSLSQSSKQEQSKMQGKGNPEVSTSALASPPEESSELPKGAAEHKVDLPQSSRVEELHGVTKEQSSEVPTPRESQDFHSNVPAEDVSQEKKESPEKDPKVQPEGTGTEAQAGTSYVYSNEGFESEPGPSSAPDVMPEQSQGTEDEAQKACQEITEITSRIDSEVETFVKTLRKLSKSDAIEKPSPHLLSSIYSKMPDLLKEVKESTSAVRNSSALFPRHRNHLVFCSKSLEGLCTDLKKYFEEVKEKLSPPNDSGDKELTGLTNDINTALLALNNITENFPEKIRELEAVVEPGDTITGLQTHSNNVSRVRLIVVGTVLAITAILIIILVGFAIYINLEVHYSKHMLNETD